MENSDRTNANNAVVILDKAARAYVAGLTDELSIAIVTPQVQAAIQIVAELVNEKYPPVTEVVPEAPAAPAAAAANDAA